MIESQTKVCESKFNQHFTGRRADLRFDAHRTRSKHVDVTLVKLSKPAARRPVRTPHGLDLVTLEKLRQLVAILSDYAGQRYRQVVTQREIRFARCSVYASLEYLEDELIPFFAILAH